MSQPEQLRKQLFQFAAHIRDPENSPAPVDVEDRRMGIYRELFFNNIKGFLDGTFPVLKSLYDDNAWSEVARSFFIRHRCQSPYFLEISREFIDYLQTEHTTRDIDPPFMFELAHYEWIELALSISQEAPDLASVDEKASLLDGHPVMSPLAWLLTYSWPVHKISPEFIPQQPADQAICIIVYRDAEDNVQFTEVNPVTAKLLQQLEQNETASGTEILLGIAEELGTDDVNPVLQAGQDILEELRQKGIILGVQRP